MPDNMVPLLIRFLEQKNSPLAKKAKEIEFSASKDAEISSIELKFREIFAGE